MALIDRDQLAHLVKEHERPGADRVDHRRVEHSAVQHELENLARDLSALKSRKEPDRGTKVVWAHTPRVQRVGEIEGSDPRSAKPL
jgi:hypothetical protein